ncbi:MAG: TRAP transporter small permease subunit [Elusimicrobiota bacterium]
MLKQKLIKIDEKIAIVEKHFVIICVLSMLFLSFLQVLLRVFFHSGISWMDVFLRHIVMISALFSASLVSHYSSHFKIEIFEKLGVEGKLKKYLSFLSSALTIFAVSIILIASVKFVYMEFDLDEIKNLTPKPEQLNLFLPLIFINMFIHTLASLFKEEKK